jgi:uncharacterized protein (TIGR04551 family)
MTSPRLSHVFVGSALALVALVGIGGSVASAQVRPGGGLPQPGQQGPTETKPEGVAEQAPKVPGALPTTPVLPPPKSKRKKFQVFELDGYFRMRSDWFKQFNLGFADDPNSGAPFPQPLGCSSTVAGVAADACKGTLRSTNMRLRLEPVINIDEKSSVHFQVDMYDNFVLGSTPDGLVSGLPAPPYIPVGAFSPSGTAPQAGRNLDRDSVVVKRAWAEVMTPLGLLKFGRMPSHWGMGLLANGGGHDPFTGEYDLDSDYGDTADRLLFGTMIPGTEIRAVIATDWPSTAPSTAQTDVYSNRYDGQPFDLDDKDDVYQWIFVVAHIDSPEDFQDLRDQGEWAFNYGTYFVWRKQEYDQKGFAVGQPPDPAQYVLRDAVAYIPDVWFRLGYKKMLIEAEAVAILGSIQSLTDIGGTLDGDNDQWDIRQFGGVGRFGYKFLDDTLHLGFEGGFASGDQWDNEPPGRINVTRAKAIPGVGDNTINAFRFDFDYEVDLILFRELMGTVSNAIYVKPTFRYDLTDRLTMKAQTVWSFAHKPVATPGNGSMYGIEIDGDIGYENEGSFAGLSYGVLFPLGALDHPANLFDDSNPGVVGDAQTAQTFQSRLVLKF